MSNNEKVVGDGKVTGDGKHTSDRPAVDSQMSTLVKNVCTLCVNECGCCESDGRDCCGEECGCCSFPLVNKAECLIVGGKCQTCNDDKIIIPSSIVKCFACKQSFHALGCKDEAPGYANMSLLTCFQRTSTRNNFLFSCDTCLTKSEMLKADKEQATYQLLHNRITQLESIIMSELTDIKSQLPKPSDVTKTSVPSVPTDVSSVGHHPPQTSSHGWSDPTKIAACKSSSTFLIKPSSPGKPAIDIPKLNNIAIENSFTIHKTSVNSKGHTIVVVEGESSSQAFMPAVANAVSNASVVKLQSRLPTVVFVGMHDSFEPDKIQDILSKANPNLGSLINNSSFKILTVKPLKNKPDLFQFVARVSNEIRSHLKNLGDKVFFGANRLLIYDHFFVRRCNKCQSFGHFEKECTSTDHICGVCSDTGHSASSCPLKAQSSSYKCSNCVKNMHPHNHATSSSTCKSFIDEQKKLKHSISYYNSGSKNSI